MKDYLRIIRNILTILFLSVTAISGAAKIFAQEQAVTKPSAPSWKLYATTEKEFSFFMPEKSLTSREGEYRPGNFNVYDTIEIGSFAQDCAMLVRVFKTDSPQELLRQHAKYRYYRDAKRTEIVLRGVKGESFVYQKEGLYFKAISFITKKNLYLLQAITHGENNLFLKQFFDSVYFNGMTEMPSLPTRVTGIALPKIANSETAAELQPELASASLRPEIMYVPMTHYTDAARARSVKGVISVEAVFTPEGEVTDVKVIRGLPDGLNDEAISAMRRVRFLPAQKNGKPVPVKMTLEFHFNVY